jgi:hypothetical protein
LPQTPEPGNVAATTTVAVGMATKSSDEREKQNLAPTSIVIRMQPLSELSSRWAATGQRHTERIDTFGRNVGDAGVRMTNTNEENARRLRDVPND